MAEIDTGKVPQNIDGPSLVAAASGLMLLPENASRLIRLHRLAALGMSLSDNKAPAASASALRSILRHQDIGGPGVLMQEDPYSEVLIQSIDFFGGPYLVSPGTGEHAVADLENLLDAAFSEGWMPDDLQSLARQLVRGLLTVSDMVLGRAGLTRGTAPCRLPGTPVDVPSPARLREVTEAAFISHGDLAAHGDWLRMVVDTFALDPGDVVHPCANDLTDDRLHITPFLRLADGYLVSLPLDLATTVRFHLLRFASQGGQLEELGKRFREAVFRRLMRALPAGSTPALLEQSDTMSRYLLKIDDRRDLHVVVATDPLLDAELEVWGAYDTRAALDRLAELVSPSIRGTYSSAEELLHLVITDSPGRAAMWGVPNVDGSDPMLIARADDLEVILHQEPDGLVGLLLFAEAIDRRPGESISTSILDEYCAYADLEKSFYISDNITPTAILFEPGDGLHSRQKYHRETDRHGAVLPPPNSAIVQVVRRYPRDAPEIFIAHPYSSYVGCVVELGSESVFITLDLKQDAFVGVELELLDSVAYWVRECAIRTGARTTAATTELVLSLSEPESWTRLDDCSTTDPPLRVGPAGSGFTLEFTQAFAALLREKMNRAERELVSVLLRSLFGTESDHLASALDKVAPLGSKRMLNAFNQNSSPDMLAQGLPRPVMGHDQITAQVLDELGEWLRSPRGGGLPSGDLLGEERVRTLNAAVRHLFERMELELAAYDPRLLLEFLIAQNESLVHDAKSNTILLKSRLACFGEQSHTVTELVQDRKNSATAMRANRFLIEYVAAQPPTGTRTIELLDYFLVLTLATEIIQRATISDFLRYGLADFEVSILGSGRLGVSREEPVTKAMDTYAANSGTRSVRAAMSVEEGGNEGDFDVVTFFAQSEVAMRAEFGFTLQDLHEVCGGLLDLATADQVTRIDRSLAVLTVSAQHDMPADLVSAVLDGITLTQRASFLKIGADAYPWRFNRDSSYVRRPLVLQGNALVFGFRSIYRLGIYWVDNMLSGRLQGRAKTTEMQQCISDARGKINGDFARSVAAGLRDLGMTTRVSVKKIGKRRILDPDGNDIGDIDVLAVHSATRSIVAIEAKDFEVARTPAEIASELEKLFTGKKGKKSTVELHTRRINWLRQHLTEVLASLGADDSTPPWRVVGAIVTSEPLVTPLVSASTIPVIPLEDLGLKNLRLTGRQAKPAGQRKWIKRTRRRR